MTTINDLPQPATQYPFKPGEAVYYAPYPGGFCNKQQLIPAIVLKIHPAPVAGRRSDQRIAILRKDGKRTSVQGGNLVYQGYCTFCGVPAVLGREDGTLECPVCGENAAAVPPPPELVLRWYPIGDDSTAITAREGFLTGCTWGEALEKKNNQRNDAFYGLLEKHRMLHEMYGRIGPWADDAGGGCFMQMMWWYAELGDEESFLAYYRAYAPHGELPAERARGVADVFKALLDAGDGPGGPSRRLVLPPLDLVRPTDDSEPDGADEVTAWLEQQFKKAA